MANVDLSPYKNQINKFLDKFVDEQSNKLIWATSDNRYSINKFLYHLTNKEYDPSDVYDIPAEIFDFCFPYIVRSNFDSSCCENEFLEWFINNNIGVWGHWLTVAMAPAFYGFRNQEDAIAFKISWAVLDDKNI